MTPDTAAKRRKIHRTQKGRSDSNMNQDELPTVTFSDVLLYFAGQPDIRESISRLATPHSDMQDIHCLVWLEIPHFESWGNRTWSTALLTGTGESFRWQGNNLATWWNKTEFQCSGHSAIHVWFIGRSPSLTHRFRVIYSSNKDNLQFNIRHGEGAADVSTPKLNKLRLRPCRIRYFGQLSYLKFRNQALARTGHVNKHMYVTADIRGTSSLTRKTPRSTAETHLIKLRTVLTAWRTVCSETLILVQLIKEFLTCHGLWRFVAVSTTASQWHYDDLHESNPHNKSCSVSTPFFDIRLGFGLSLPVCV